MATRWYIGLSSGSSLTGVDAALVRVEGHAANIQLQLEYYRHLAYSKELHDHLIQVHGADAPEWRRLAALHRILGETFALAVKQLLEQSRMPAQHVLCIASPGQELWHEPDGRYPAALNFGMAGVLAERTGLTTLSGFADRDVAVGGQGGPMTALVDALMFHDPREHRALLHLGSVATLVWLPAQLGPNWRHVSGFQAAPCTLLLDGLMRLLTNGRELLDAGGKHAVQGRCLEPLLSRWLQDSFFQQRPPKSVSRRAFGPDFWNRAVAQAKSADGNLHDVLCTMTHFIARSILHALQNHVPAMPARILLSGRGVRNGFLWRLIEQLLGDIPVAKTDAFGIPTEARKAVAHAGLAALTMDGVPVSLPSVTGATGSRMLGQFTPGASANWSRCLAWMARQAVPLPSAA